MSLGKYRKVQNLFHSNRKISLEIDKYGKENVTCILQNNFYWEKKIYGRFIIKSSW